MDNKIIVGLGEALWDCLPEGRKIGGAPANFAYHASQFGFDSYAVSAVGNDPLGDETIEALKSNGLKLEMPRVDFPTGQVQVTLDEDGVATYDIKEGSAWDNIPFTPEIEALAVPCRMLRFIGTAQQGFARHHLSFPRRHSEGLYAHLRHQPAPKFLLKGDYPGVTSACQRDEDKRRGTGHPRSDVWLSRDGLREQVLAHPRQVQSRHARVDLRSQRQLCLLQGSHELS